MPQAALALMTQLAAARDDRDRARRLVRNAEAMRDGDPIEITEAFGRHLERAAVRAQRARAAGLQVEIDAAVTALIAATHAETTFWRVALRKVNETAPAMPDSSPKPRRSAMP